MAQDPVNEAWGDYNVQHRKVLKLQGLLDELERFRGFLDRNLLNDQDVLEALSDGAKSSLKEVLCGALDRNGFTLKREITNAESSASALATKARLLEAETYIRAWCPHCRDYLIDGAWFKGRHCGTCHTETIEDPRIKPPLPCPSKHAATGLVCDQNDKPAHTIHHAFIGPDSDRMAWFWRDDQPWSWETEEAARRGIFLESIQGVEASKHVNGGGRK